MHKWALKQFMRIVAHGRHVGAHLSQRHTAQFLFSQPPAPAEPAQPRHCHCGGDPCPHSLHVHAEMPGLREGDDGQYVPKRQFKRSVETMRTDEAPESFRHALAVFIADLNGGRYQDAVLPRKVYRAQTMELSWHDADGNLSVCGKHCAQNTGICLAYAWLPARKQRNICRAYAQHMPPPCNAFHHSTIVLVHSITPLVLYCIVSHHLWCHGITSLVIGVVTHHW